MSEYLVMKEKKKRITYNRSLGKNEVKRQKLDLMPGCKGVLITFSTVQKSREAIREFLNIVSRHTLDDGILDDNRKSINNADNLGRMGDTTNVDRIQSEIILQIKQLNKDHNRFVPIKNITKTFHLILFMTYWRRHSTNTYIQAAI